MRTFLITISVLVLSVLAMFFKVNNPSNDYYISLFKEISGLVLSDNVDFISKNHKEYFVQREFGSCFIVRLNSQQREIYMKSTVELEEPKERSCGSNTSKKYSFKGINSTDYPFMNWYISKDNYLWAYYEKY